MKAVVELDIRSMMDAAQNTVWISPSQNLDDAFRAHAGKATTFRLSAGTHLTRGPWAFPDQQWCQIGSGSRIIGEGSHRTYIKLASDAVTRTGGKERVDLGVLRCGDSVGCSASMEVTGVTIDGNARVHRGRDRLVTVGVRFFGSAVRCEDVVVEDIRGSNELSQEAFGISTINGRPLLPNPQGGAVIRDCAVQACDANAYISAFSIGYRPLDGTIIRSLVDNCRVTVQKENHAAFTACHNTTFRNCSSVGTKCGFYNDTDSVSGLLFEGCDIEASYAGIFLVASRPEDFKRRVRAIGCNFDLTGKTGAVIGVGLVDKSGAKAVFEEIVVQASTFNTDNPRFALVSSDSPRLQDIIIEQCMLPGQAAIWQTTGHAEAIATASNRLRGGKLVSVLPALRA